MRAARRVSRGAPSARWWPSLLLFTDPTRTPRIVEVVQAMPRGAGLVYRAFGAADAARQGARIARAAASRGVWLSVGADPRLAIAVNARGLHLPQRAPHRKGQILAWRRRFVVTAAAHDALAIRRARLAGVQAVIVSPVFPSASFSAAQPMGPLAFRRLVLGAGLPVYALGGVNAQTAQRIAGCGAKGIAAVEAVVEAVRI